MSAEPAPSSVDFGYAFATPHRLTAARPNSRDKTLLDLQPGSLRISWTYSDLSRAPLYAFVTPPVHWGLLIKPAVDGRPFEHSTWHRVDGDVPVLRNEYRSEGAGVTLTVTGGRTAAIVRIELENTGNAERRFTLGCQSTAWGENPAWVSPGVERADVLVAGWNDRADRVLCFGMGSDACVATTVGRQVGFEQAWVLAPGARRTAWLVRPYRAVAADLPALRAHDWAAEAASAYAEWRRLLARAMEVRVPDAGVASAFRACLADLFIMREPIAGGRLAGVPGTEVYRAPNSYEAGIAAVAIDQCGLHRDAAAGYSTSLELQEPDGNWSEPKGWGHLMWGGSGFKAWAGMEHYWLTRDRAYLDRLYPRLLANSRWQERMRATTRVLRDGARPLTYGLMPRGMGDCGLMDGEDLYGVFLPHNIWAVFADSVAVQAAVELGRTADLPELRGIFDTAKADLLDAMDRGAIPEDGYRWIPGVPGKTSGSRWGALNALFPCALLPADHPLISGTVRRLESRMSPGGLPVHTGWMPDGMWVAITLDNLAEAHLVRGNGDAAARYLIAVLNHATPLVTWCEERGQAPGASDCAGDRQHLWTPVAVVRALRDCLVMEDGEGLHLLRGSDRAWLASGSDVGVTGAATRFGKVAFAARFDASAGEVRVKARFDAARGPAWADVHVRLPDGWRAVSVAGVDAQLRGPECVRVQRPRGAVSLVVKVAR